MTYLSMGQATAEAMRSEMRADPRVIVMGEDIRFGGSFGTYRGLYEEFGDRVIDMPIAEALIASAAVGAALAGLRPVAYLGFAEFALSALDEIINQAAKMRFMFGGQVSVPVVFRISDGALGSSAAQHSGSLEALFTHIPGLKVVAPSRPADAKGLLLAAIRDPDPVIFLENKRIQPAKQEVPPEPFAIPLGLADVRRPGADMTIIAYGSMAVAAEEACTQLEKEGVDAELIDLRSLVPLDWPTVLSSVRRTGLAIVCHEAWLFGGFGAEIASRLSAELHWILKHPPVRVGAMHSHAPFSPPLEAAIFPTSERIVDAARTALVAARSHESGT